MTKGNTALDWQAREPALEKGILEKDILGKRRPHKIKLKKSFRCGILRTLMVIVPPRILRMPHSPEEGVTGYHL